MLKNLNILVTGGTGFIGDHLVKNLVKSESNVICLARRTSDVSHLEKLNTKIIYGNLLDKNSLKVIDKEDIDIVFHLAAGGNVSDISERAYQLFRKLNVEGTQNLLAHCKGIKRFVHFSSIAAMGVIINKTVDENTSCEPVLPYEKSKYESEIVVSESGLPFTILRPSMVYGEGDRKSEILLLCRLIKKGVLPIIGNGNNLIPLTYVSNIVQGALLAIKTKKSINETYILCDEKSYPLNQIANTIAKIEDVNFKKIYIPKTLGNTFALGFELSSKIFNITPLLTRRKIYSMTNSRIFSISKVKKNLGYKPIDLKSGLKHTIPWYEKAGLI